MWILLTSAVFPSASHWPGHTKTTYHASCASLLMLEIMADLRDLVLPLQQEPPSEQQEAMADVFRQAGHHRQRS